jgi:hypothetical protein
MLQEIATLSVVAFAIIMAVRLMFQNLSVHKRKGSAKADKRYFPLQGKCSDCLADCPLRNSVEKKTRRRIMYHPSQVKGI